IVTRSPTRLCQRLFNCAIQTAQANSARGISEGMIGAAFLTRGGRIEEYLIHGFGWVPILLFRSDSSVRTSKETDTSVTPSGQCTLSVVLRAAPGDALTRLML